jgi:hypothetical protein
LRTQAAADEAVGAVEIHAAVFSAHFGGAGFLLGEFGPGGGAAGQCGGEGEQGETANDHDGSCFSG